MNILKKTCHQAQLIVMLFLVGVMAGQAVVVLLDGQIDLWKDGFKLNGGSSSDSRNP